MNVPPVGPLCTLERYWDDEGVMGAQLPRKLVKLLSLRYFSLILPYFGTLGGKINHSFEASVLGKPWSVSLSEFTKVLNFNATLGKDTETPGLPKRIITVPAGPIPSSPASRKASQKDSYTQFRVWI